MEITLEEFRDSLQATVKDAIDNATKKAQSTPIQPCDSIWTVLYKCGLKPSVISAPEDYEGSEHLNIKFTQAGLTAKEQKDQLKLWARELPKFTTVKYLWFSSGRVNQELFDIACSLPQLEGLFVEMSNIENIEMLKSATALKYLNLRNSTKIKSIEPLSDLGNLRWIQLQNIRQIVDLSPISTLINLEGLEFRGAPDGRHTVKSFSPLQGLLSLKWLELGGIYTEDDSLRPLATLKSLRWISLGGYFTWEEFAWLSSQLPTTECSWFSPYYDLGPHGIHCNKCNSGKVILSGKGKPTLCPTCDSDRVQKHVVAFQKVAQNQR